MQYNTMQYNTTSPLYTDIRYDDYSRYNDNFDGTDPKPKIDRLMERFKNIVFNTQRNKCCGYLLESPRCGKSYKYPQDFFIGVKDSALALILRLFGLYIQLHIVYKVKK